MRISDQPAMKKRCCAASSLRFLPSKVVKSRFLGRSGSSSASETDRSALEKQRTQYSGFWLPSARFKGVRSLPVSPRVCGLLLIVAPALRLGISAIQSHKPAVILLFFLTTFAASPLLAFANVAKIISAIEDQTPWKPFRGDKGTILDSKALSGEREQRSEAAVFVEYGFSKLTRVRLINPDEQFLTVDVYEMLDSPAAYGVFTYLRPLTAEPLNGIGNIGVETIKDVAFQQSKYYVVVKTGGSISAPRQSILQVSRVISKSLPTDFSLPSVAGKLPSENRVLQSEKFVMGAEALSRLLPLGSKDPFGLATGAEAALAKYEQAGGESATLLLIHYPTQQLARRFLEAGYQQYSAQYPDQPAFYKRDGPMVVLVLASNSPELATALLERVSYVSIVSWDPKVEPPSIGQVMINIFIFCGVMLAMTFAAGFVFGIARIVIKRYFPGKVFDRPETMEVIRLHLDEKP